MNYIALAVWALIGALIGGVAGVIIAVVIFVGLHLFTWVMEGIL